MPAVILTLAIVFAGGLYLRGWRQRRSIPVWRACSFFLGLLATWLAVASPLASLDSHMLTAHMIQHLLLMTIAPPLIWLGEPRITLMRSERWSFPTGLGRLVGHPVFCWLSAAAALIVWHAPPIFELGMLSPAWHFIEHASFLTTGLLFWWPVIQPWPSVARWPRWSMLLYLFLATLPCDVLSGLLVFSDRVAYPMYLCKPGNGGLSPLEDQQCAAALMWTCVTVVFVVTATILSTQILSPQPGQHVAVCDFIDGSGRKRVQMRDYLELTKPRITVLILICAAVGYWFGCGASLQWMVLGHALLGTALLASGTSALNQWYEADSDSKMRRTRGRPLPAGRMTRRQGLAFGLLLSAVGFADLWYGANLLAAALGLFTLVSYLLLYTPLKQRSPVCTTVGAIPGAMPPLIGYAAAGHGIDAGAVALFLILFVWQFPHFDAIACMYRDDYARGGIRMLPVVEPGGESTARRIVICSLLLIPISLVPTFLGIAGAAYAAAAIGAGLGVLYFGARFGRERTAPRARALLLATVSYLPALLGVMVLDRRVL